MFLKRLKHRIGCGTFVIFQYPPQRFPGVFQGGGGWGASESNEYIGGLGKRNASARGSLGSSLFLSVSVLQKLHMSNTNGDVAVTNITQETNSCHDFVH